MCQDTARLNAAKNEEGSLLGHGGVQGSGIRNQGCAERGAQRGAEVREKGRGRGGIYFATLDLL